eukprot:TRINITY_DN67854_c0_g1_i1.p1 TRINITY_DN67854_c0_g1~~TRINITY_DN67854_c0_g1_i1.p1  ORF type:complete len:670 (+),score=76.76 TRINITY_DN67854_c0_g1_i1:182-2191(+)
MALGGGGVRLMPARRRLCWTFRGSLTHRANGFVGCSRSCFWGSSNIASGRSLALLRSPQALSLRSLSSSATSKGQASKSSDRAPGEISPLPLLWSIWPKDPWHNARVAFALGGLVVGKALAIWAPLQLGLLVDSLGAGAEVLPVGLLAGYGLARLSSSAFNELRQALFATVSQSICRSLAKRCFEHLHSLDVAYLISAKPGAMSVIVSRATKSVQQVLTMVLFNFLPIGVEFALAIGVMGKVAGLDCVVATALTVSAYTWFTTYYSNMRRTIMRRSNKAEEDANSVFLDSLTNCEAVKYFQNEKQELQRYDSFLARFESNQISVLRSLAALNFGQQIIVVSGFTAILTMTASRVIAGTLPVGDVVAIHAILAQLMQPLGILGGVYRVTTQGFIDLGKVAGFLNLKSALLPPTCGGAPFSFQGGHVEFRDIHFNHRVGESTDSSPVFTGVSINVPSGTKMAIVGPSGSGKSTLLKLLYRLMDPSQGQVLIDGQDLATLDLDSFRNHLGIVPQDCALFNDSIEYNIRYGRLDASKEEIVHAAKLAQIHELITSLPDGYSTSVGERGLKLSGGERQRIGVARCLLRNPSIVLLDEATSALDVQTERNLVTEIDELARGRTSIVIAHRLSTVRRCDRVAFLEGGVVVDQGSHDELMERCSRYFQFWEGRPSDA